MTGDEFAPLSRWETIGIWVMWLSVVFFWILGVVTFIGWVF